MSNPPSLPNPPQTLKITWPIAKLQTKGTYIRVRRNQLQTLVLDPPLTKTDSIIFYLTTLDGKPWNTHHESTGHESYIPTPGITLEIPRDDATSGRVKIHEEGDAIALIPLRPLKYVNFKFPCSAILCSPNHPLWVFHAQGMIKDTIYHITQNVEVIEESSSWTNDSLPKEYQRLRRVHIYQHRILLRDTIPIDSITLAHHTRVSNFQLQELNPFRTRSRPAIEYLPPPTTDPQTPQSPSPTIPDSTLHEEVTQHTADTQDENPWFMEFIDNFEKYQAPPQPDPTPTFPNQPQVLVYHFTPTADAQTQTNIYYPPYFRSSKPLIII